MLIPLGGMLIPTQDLGSASGMETALEPHPECCCYYYV